MECVQDKNSQPTPRQPSARCNAITIEFKDGSKTREVSSNTRSASPPPQGRHPLLVEKFRTNPRVLSGGAEAAILSFAWARRRKAMPVHEFVDLMVILITTFLGTFMRIVLGIALLAAAARLLRFQLKAGL
jgi:hypothetical protein